MDPITIISGVIMAIGAIAGIAVGIIKIVNSNNESGGCGFGSVSHVGPTHADVYKQTHQPNPRVVENNMRYLNQMNTTSTPTYVPAPVQYHQNIDPVYAPITMPMMQNASYTQYQTCWATPVTFQPTYPPVQYTPTERNQQAVIDMCEMMNKMKPNRPVSEDIIDCVLASVEPNRHRYGNAPGIC